MPVVEFEFLPAVFVEDVLFRAAGLLAEAIDHIGVEVHPELVPLARRNLADRPNVTVIEGDGLAPPSLPGFNKAVFTCALREVPAPYLDALPEGGRLVAPLLAEGADDQVLTLTTRIHGKLAVSQHGPVRYVASASRAAV